MTISEIGRDEEFSVLIVPDDRSFISDGNIITDLNTIKPNSENIGFDTWSARSRIVDLI